MAITTRHTGICTLNMAGVNWGESALPLALLPLTQLQSLTLHPPSLSASDLQALGRLPTLRRLAISDTLLGSIDQVRAQNTSEP